MLQYSIVEFLIWERRRNEMDKVQPFGEVQDVEVTILVDNRADLILESTDTVKRFTDTPLLAEHGFAALIDLKSVNMRILWDTGMMPTTMLENMLRMEIDPTTIDKVVISHGHRDHTAGVTEILKAIDARPSPKEWEPDSTPEDMAHAADWHRIPLIAHPAAYRERWSFPEEGRVYGPILPPPQDEWRALGAEIILSERPYQLGPGCWATGEVPCLSFENSGRSATMRYREGDAFLPDDIEEDQAIVLHVKDKGLVVVSGCAHSGIVNTVNYAIEISGVERVWAILGGFHLARSPEDELALTVEAIKKFEPKLIAPSHCTGFKAMCRFAVEMPEAFTYGVVGTKYLF
jgi:7,8-dihydropterin-6-yl-methyl-4-(beta-D-ribofuranosyl)aminobenzene 5'-phosphate synthase